MTAEIDNAQKQCPPVVTAAAAPPPAAPPPAAPATQAGSLRLPIRRLPPQPHRLLLRNTDGYRRLRSPPPTARTSSLSGDAPITPGNPARPAGPARPGFRAAAGRADHRGRVGPDRLVCRVRRNRQANFRSRCGDGGGVARTLVGHAPASPCVRRSDRIRQGQSRRQRPRRRTQAGLLTPADRQFVWAADSKPVLVAWGFVKILTIPAPRPRLSVKACCGRAIICGRVCPARRQRASLPPFLPPVRFRGLSGSAAFRRPDGRDLLFAAAGVRHRGGSGRQHFPPLCSGGMPYVGICKSACARARRAERKIRNAELEIARQQGDCAPRPQAQLPPTPAPPQPGPSIDERLREQHAQKGALEISLSWNGLEDLDLHVKCPGGEVSFSTRTACNDGHLDVDMNNEKDDVNAVEHSVWADPPAGQYEVSVNFFSLKSQTPRTIPFTVRIVHGTDTQTIEGTVSVVGESEGRQGIYIVTSGFLNNAAATLHRGKQPDHEVRQPKHRQDHARSA